MFIGDPVTPVRTCKTPVPPASLPREYGTTTPQRPRNAIENITMS